MIELKVAKTVSVGRILYHMTLKNADGSPQRFKVIGAPKTWKRSPDMVQISVKRGMYEFGKIDESMLENFALSEEECLKSKA